MNPKDQCLTRQTIIALEANRYVPSLLLAVRIARAFGTSVEDVFQMPDDLETGDPVLSK